MLTVGSVLRGLWYMVQPPAKLENEPQHNYDWKVGISFVQLLTAGALLMHLLWAIGLGALLGLGGGGYVQADEFNELNAKANSNTLLGLAIIIEQKHDQVCRAKDMGEDELALAYEQQIRDKQTEYRAVNPTGANYELLRCPGESS